ncbi:MAG: hypothetical protein KZQ66_01120 [Candidatus Thiodiazotropha sp. (ex Lucinoma aequizonata)]|nr:hypothetical protein [Candidatus Thiodiazotropha sp. (ex Lucinoma aequizonata)]MCU7888184.1 hypothetical protein [Candidatus Thiodiazotropha sp. (ex Lucinoma aequizonata)]MCU7896595.1 hypothetical protein [Candidatus Thiodiazotropha sp. (ex Lucinoma aequizonata)]MCU7900148.1 hypothetical protein [Candidatus Thiodiazotropha sp. (ex Lucinoma aequizonata)]MCU7900785.1 hypothetical protein [Candidatus Thiodiazotropha sp. (ex Lucinoma aequizonata)]
MALPKDENQNHSEPGSTIKVEPIRNVKAIRRIKMLLVDRPRNLCFFTFGINTAYRANEILSVKVGQVAHSLSIAVSDSHLIGFLALAKERVRLLPFGWHPGTQLLRAHLNSYLT